MATDQPKRILLVEADPQAAALTRSAIQAHEVGIEVDVVGDGEEALDYLYRRKLFQNRVETPPALVILDLKLPKLSGAKTLQMIKSDQQLKCLPTIMFTSSREAQDLRTCYRLGANGYVFKPVDGKRFSIAIKNLATYWVATNEAPP